MAFTSTTRRKWRDGSTLSARSVRVNALMRSSVWLAPQSHRATGIAPTNGGADEPFLIPPTDVSPFV